MAITLFEASVLNYLQGLGAVSGFLKKGFDHLNERKIDPSNIVEARIFPDMLTFRFQIQILAYHSIGAIDAIMLGEAGKPEINSEDDYQALQAVIEKTRGTLEEVAPKELNAREGMDVSFGNGENKRTLTAENFLLSFSLPNFYFHAATAYDLLRSHGAPLGKRDFLGKLRLKE
jgi:uncharacterized protein